MNLEKCFIPKVMNKLVDNSRCNKKRKKYKLVYFGMILLLITITLIIYKEEINRRSVIAEMQEPIIVGFPLRGEWLSPNTPGTKIPSHGTNQ